MQGRVAEDRIEKAGREPPRTGLEIHHRGRAIMPQDPPSATAGFTAIPNELMDEILRADFSKRELLVVLAVVRKTLGWQKESDELSLGQIRKLTGLDRSNSAKALKSLSAKGVLSIRPGHRAQVIKLVTNIGKWKRGRLNQVLSNQPQECGQNGNKGVVKTATTKDTLQKTASKRKNGRELPDWLPADAWKDWKEFRKRKAPLTDRAVTLTLNTLGRLRKQGHDPREVIEQSIERGWTGLFPLKGSNKTNTDSGVL